MDTINHEGPKIFNTMRDLMVRFFEHLEITSRLDLYLRIKDTESIMVGPAPKKLTGPVKV